MKGKHLRELGLCLLGMLHQPRLSMRHDISGRADQGVRRSRPFDDGPISDLRTNKWRPYASQVHERFGILGLQFPIDHFV